jgi:hypothetical protein
MTDPDEIYRHYSFTRPSFIEGLGRIFDLGHSRRTYEMAPDGAEADARALEQDWQTIGRDFQMILGSPRHTAPQEKLPCANSREESR